MKGYNLFRKIGYKGNIPEEQKDFLNRDSVIDLKNINEEELIAIIIGFRIAKQNYFNAMDDYVGGFEDDRALLEIATLETIQAILDDYLKLKIEK